MPIDICSSLNKISQYTFGSSFLYNTFGNTLSVSLIISIIMMLLVIILYPAHPNTSFITVLKLFMYMFLGSLVVVFLHNSVIKYYYEEKHNNAASLDIIRGINANNRDAVYGNYQSIQPSSTQQNQDSQTSQDNKQDDNLNDAINTLLNQPIEHKDKANLTAKSISNQPTLEIYPPRSNPNPYK